MPVGTADPSITVRKDLKTAPPDGFVEIRKLTFGQLGQRRSMTKMKVSADRKSRQFEGELDLAGQKATEFDFAHAIVDHNITDPAGTKLDFRKPSDIWRLDPRIGDEISKYIDELNQFEEESEEGDTPNSNNGSKTELSEE